MQGAQKFIFLPPVTTELPSSIINRCSTFYNEFRGIEGGGRRRRTPRVRKRGRTRRTCTSSGEGDLRRMKRVERMEKSQMRKGERKGNYGGNSKEEEEVEKRRQQEKRKDLKKERKRKREQVRR